MSRGLRTKTNFEWETGRPGVPLGWKTREKLSSDGKVWRQVGRWLLVTLLPGAGLLPLPWGHFLPLQTGSTRPHGFRWCLQVLGTQIATGFYLTHLSSEDVEMMRVGAGARRSRGQGEFVSGDPSLPPGWLVRMGANGRQSFRCPRYGIPFAWELVLFIVTKNNMHKKTG